MPTLSFIVPVYNVEKYLPRCLDSLVKQSGYEFEILCVNDGSTDLSPKILEDYKNRYPHLIRTLHKANGGLSDARNYGLAEAKGEIIAFVDSDDFLREDFLSLTVEKMQRENLDLLLTDFYYYYDSGNEIPVKARKGLSENAKKEAVLAAPMAWMRLYRRHLLKDAPFLKGIYYEDLEMTPEMILSAERVGFLDECVYYYYQREGSIMRQSSFQKKFLDIFKVLDRVYQKFEEKGALEEYRKEIEFLYIEHLLRSAALRFATLEERKMLFPMLRKAVKEKFPRWKKNPYLKKSSLFFRTTVFFAGKNLSLAVSLLARLKG